MILGPTEEQAITLSPFVMYNVTIASELSKNKCSDDICWSKASFTWLSSKTCSGKFVCKNLKGNVCGNYGIVFNQHAAENDSDPVEFCIESDLVRVENISKNDVIELEFWHHHTSTYEGAIPDDIQCYLWCTTSGLEPVIRQPDSNIYISKNANVFRPVVDGQGMSPHLIYYFNDSYASHSQGDCNHYNGKCLRVYSINWYHSYPGVASISCPNMTGNICGEYAIGMVFRNSSGSQGNSVCERGALVRDGIEPGGKLMVYISNDEILTSTFQCMVWVTGDGSLPMLALQQLRTMVDPITLSHSHF